MLFTPIFASFVGVGKAGVGGNAGSSFLMAGASPDGIYNVAENMAAFDRWVILAIVFWILQKTLPAIFDALTNHELSEAGKKRIADSAPLKEANHLRWMKKASGNDLSLLARLAYEKTGKIGAWDPQRDRWREDENERNAEQKALQEEFRKNKPKGKKRH